MFDRNDDTTTRIVLTQELFDNANEALEQTKKNPADAHKPSLLPHDLTQTPNIIVKDESPHGGLDY